MHSRKTSPRTDSGRTAVAVLCILMVVALVAGNTAYQFIYGGPKDGLVRLTTAFSAPRDVPLDTILKNGLDRTLSDTVFIAESEHGSVSFCGSEIALSYDPNGTEREFYTDAQGQLVILETIGTLRCDLTALRGFLAPLAGEDGVEVTEPYYEIDYDKAQLTLHPGSGGYGVDARAFIAGLSHDIYGSAPISCTVGELDTPVLIMEEIHRRACTEPQDAHIITHDDNSQAYIKEVIGVSFDLAAAMDIAPDSTGTYTIPLTITQPAVTLADVMQDAFPDLLVSYKTNYIVGQVSRSSNLALAAELINGTILQPGQQFSFNDVVGERTAENGFKKATVYLNEGTGEDYGGGICQVSSTLYYSCILADLQIDERKNHKYTVTYMLSAKGGEVVYGNDATVNWGYVDYKFSNNKDKPIRIEMHASGGELFCEIWGTADGRTADFAYNQTMTVPYKIKYMPASAGSSDQIPHTGRVIEVYRIRYVDGVEVSRTLEHKNTYQAMTHIMYTNELPAGFQYGVEYAKDYDPATAPTTTTAAPTTTTTAAPTTTSTTAPEPTTTTTAAPPPEPGT